MNMRMMLTLFVLVVMTTVSASEQEAKRQDRPCEDSWDKCYAWCKVQPLAPDRLQNCCIFVNSIQGLPNRDCDGYD
nr:conotoxin K M23.2 [Conus magus]